MQMAMPCAALNARLCHVSCSISNSHTKVLCAPIATHIQQLCAHRCAGIAAALHACQLLLQKLKQSIAGNPAVLLQELWVCQGPAGATYRCTMPSGRQQHSGIRRQRSIQDHADMPNRPPCVAIGAYFLFHKQDQRCSQHRSLAVQATKSKGMPWFGLVLECTGGDEGCRALSMCTTHAETQELCI